MFVESSGNSETRARKEKRQARLFSWFGNPHPSPLALPLDARWSTSSLATATRLKI
jgi:hypothetical protein